MTSSILDVAIGLMVVYLVFSTVCTVATEWWSRLRTARPRQLQRFLQAMLGSASWTDTEFYGHPLIAALRTPRIQWKDRPAPWRLPAYIPERIFALAMLDLAFSEDLGKGHHLELNDGLPDDLCRTLHALTNCTRNSCQHTQDRLERWFRESMERLTGRYTRYAHTLVLVISSLMTIALNIDTLEIAKNLSLNPATTQAAISMATNIGQQTPGDPGAAAKKLTQAFQALQVPVGWHEQPIDQAHLVLSIAGKLVGWLVTICALSLGAPFWFDTLNRVMSLRQAGPKPAQSS